MQNAIKIAYDFVSVPNLEATVDLLPQQREHRLQADGHGDDVLQLRSLIWYAWKSVSNLWDSIPPEPDSTFPSKNNNFLP